MLSTEIWKRLLACRKEKAVTVITEEMYSSIYNFLLFFEFIMTFFAHLTCLLPNLNMIGQSTFVQAPVCALPSKNFCPYSYSSSGKKITFKHSVVKHIVKNGWATWSASRWTARSKCVSIPWSAECKIKSNNFPSYRT